MIRPIQPLILAAAILLASKTEASTTAKFLLIDPSPRAVAMGSSISSACDDANAVFYNPSLMGFFKETKAAFSYAFWLEELSHFSTFGVIPFDRAGALGLGFIGLSTGGIINTIDSGGGLIQTTGESASALDLCLLGSYSYAFFDSLSAGVTLKYIFGRLETASAHAFASDIGISWRHPYYRISLSALAQNLGSKQTFQSESFPLPFIAKLGTSYEFLINERGKGFRSILFTLEGRYRPEDGLNGGTGLEINLFNILYLRGGYEYDPLNDTRGFKTGLGVKHRNSSIPETRISFQADYGIDFFQNFGPTHSLQLKMDYYFFGDRVPRQEKEVLRASDSHMRDPLTYDKAYPGYQKVIRNVPSHIRSAYNIACIYAMDEDLENAVKWLEYVSTLDNRLQIRKRIESDRDFDLIRNTPEFEAVLDRFKRR